MMDDLALRGLQIELGVERGLHQRHLRRPAAGKLREGAGRRRSAPDPSRSLEEGDRGESGDSDLKFNGLAFGSDDEEGRLLLLWPTRPSLARCSLLLDGQLTRAGKYNAPGRNLGLVPDRRRRLQPKHGLDLHRRTGDRRGRAAAAALEIDEPRGRLPDDPDDAVVVNVNGTTSTTATNWYDYLNAGHLEHDHRLRLHRRQLQQRQRPNDIEHGVGPERRDLPEHRARGTRGLFNTIAADSTCRALDAERGSLSKRAEATIMPATPAGLLQLSTLWRGVITLDGSARAALRTATCRRRDAS